LHGALFLQRYGTIMLDPVAILRLAHGIDADRARQLGASEHTSIGAALGVLLGTAFQPMAPVHGWQHDALGQLALGLGRKRSRRGMSSAFARNVDEGPHFVQQLRRHAWVEKARIALRELLPGQWGGPDVDETARELSHLADVVLEFSLREASAHVRSRFGAAQRADGQASSLVVFGMGKLGGQELNAGSDIDIVFAYDTDDGGSSVSLHEHWSAVAQRVVSTIETPDEAGAIFRVDLRLRPEGSRGPLVNSLAATERYYETWGRAWERAAWLRGRPCAGDGVLGATLVRELFTPFVFRQTIDPGMATVLAELIARTRAEALGDVQNDLKIGKGGIREAEFFVQSLQLIYGGEDTRIREPNTLRGLARLASRGWVKERDAEDLERAYLLLRRVEHRVQWASGIPTHALPADEADRDRLARSMGYKGAAELQAQLTTARNRVHELFLSVLPGAPPTVSPHTRLIARLDGNEPWAESPEQEEKGSELHEHLRALARRPDALLGSVTRDQFPKVIDDVLSAIHESSNPEQAAQYLRSYFAKVGPAAAVIRPLVDDSVALARFVNILGASAFVGDAIVARPDLADIVLFGAAQLSEINPQEIVVQELEQMRRSLPDGVERYEARDQFIAALRMAKGKVMVDVAAADLGGLMESRETTRVLSVLADESLEQAVRFELGNPPKGLAVIAVGKLGSCDIGYGSDLDVLFIYDPDAAPEGSFAPDYFTRVAQRVIGVISETHWAGPGYELDTRLRPSGSKGLLVASLQSFARYHRISLPGVTPDENEPAVFSSGAAWERQTLTRARCVAGDKELGAHLIEIAHRAAYEQGPPSVEEMHHLRMRMERELAREQPGHYDVKVGRGGLLDVEFACQWLQMRHGCDERVRTTDSVLGLGALRDAGYLDDDLFRTLRDGYVFLRQLEQRIRVLRGTGESVIDAQGEGLEHLARRMGIRGMAGGTGAELLITRYQATTNAVRLAYLQVLGLSQDAG
jgi:glutamate-ammonia-ligase adenylyltransferase